MDPRIAADDGAGSRDGMSAPPHPGRTRLSAERLREIRQRIAEDRYRSADVAGEIARRILVSRDL